MTSRRRTGRKPRNSVQSLGQPLSREALSAYSEATIAGGSNSFALASLFFESEMRRDAQMLYAWCRRCDDVIDGQHLGGDAPDALMTSDERRRLLEELRRLTARSLTGEPTGDPAFDSFAEVAARHQLPVQYANDLLDGFEFDIDAATYATIGDTLRYCYGVAGVVGVMMAIVMGVDRHDEETLDRACDLGLAFQLTNICRDVIDDARAGRIYLPLDLLAREGAPADPATLLDPAQREKVWRCAVQVLDVAEAYYASATDGVRRLPPRAAAAIAAARNVYRDIGRRIREGGPSAWDRRITTSGRRKMALASLGCVTGISASVALKSKPAAPRAGLWSRSALTTPAS